MRTKCWFRAQANPVGNTAKLDKSDLFLLCCFFQLLPTAGVTNINEIHMKDLAFILCLMRFLPQHGLQPAASELHDCGIHHWAI